MVAEVSFRSGGGRDAVSLLGEMFPADPMGINALLQSLGQIHWPTALLALLTLAVLLLLPCLNKRIPVALVAVARDSSETSVSLHEHVDLINRNFTPEQKFELVRGMWQVACADDQIHHHEEALIRRLADLLYVSHSDFIRSKLKVLDDA